MTHLGRPATGSIVWADPETKTKPIGVRVTRANGKRKLVRFDPGTSASDAIALAPSIAESARFAVDDTEGTTVAEYAKRWCEWREARGVACVADDRTRLALHALPTIGALPIDEDRAQVRTELKKLVALLDARARAGFTERDGKRSPFAPKTALHVWTVVCALFRDACRAKDPSLCVRDDNPAEGIAAPDVGARKAKQYLWPSEFAALVSSERVPVRWRRLFALAVYTYTRAGELAALEWADVDLEHGTIHIHRSRDRKADRTKTTKTDTARRIPIEANLRPLLAAMREQAGGEKARGTIVSLPASGQLATKLRAYLRRVGVEREELFTTDATRKAITFHDLRATGITWCAVRGDDALKIKQRAGHAGFGTTEGYIREAENMRHGFGVVFPPLPASLGKRGPVRPTPEIVSASLSAFRRRPLRGTSRNMMGMVGEAGFEPATTSTQSSCTTGLCDSPGSDSLLERLLHPCHDSAGRGPDEIALPRCFHGLRVRVWIVARPGR
jgi:integrase